MYVHLNSFPSYILLKSFDPNLWSQKLLALTIVSLDNTRYEGLCLKFQTNLLRMQDIAEEMKWSLVNQMFEKQSYPKSSPSLPKSTMSASGRVTLGLTGVWWRQTPIAGTDASRTYDARYYRVYVHDLRFHPSHHITTLPGTIPLPAFERFPAFPAPTLTTTNFS